MILAELGSAYWRRLTRCVRHMMEGTRMEMRVSWNTLEHQLCELSAYYRKLNNNNCLWARLPQWPMLKCPLSKLHMYL